MTTADIIFPVPDATPCTFHHSNSGDPASPLELRSHGSGSGVASHTNWDRKFGELAGNSRDVGPEIANFGDSAHPAPPARGFHQGVNATSDLWSICLEDEWSAADWDGFALVAPDWMTTLYAKTLIE